MNKLAPVAMVLALVGTSPAFATLSEDVQSVSSAFQADAVAGGAIIGLSLLTAAGAAVVWKWLKAALFS